LRLFGLISILCLAACSTGAPPLSSLPLPEIPRVPNISKAEQPFPDDYAQLITRRLLARGEIAELSKPARYEPWSINDAVGWSVCLKRADASVTLVILATGKVVGTAAPAPAGYCESVTYLPIEREALPVEDPNAPLQEPPTDYPDAEGPLEEEPIENV
jgi:hypothetical protein